MNKLFKILKNPRIIFQKINLEFTKTKFGHVGNKISIGSGLITKGEKNIFIGDNFLCGKNVKIETWEYYNNEKTGMIPRLSIGNNVSINDNCFISCLNEIKIGDGVLCGENVFICDNFHGKNSIEEIDTIPIKRALWSKGPITIGNNSWIGRNVCIMPNVTIGNNCVIGANAVVTHDIPHNSIAAGVPAKVIKKIDNKE
ncbi:MAG: acyltransferase [Clostridia bacterium]|nr:acyltransferase [Clostridia bacterium]